ncbi:MAG: shikimate dehydrogenase [Clostridia bacterium]|nr:shikimate dehydrogenase [Clostridia bacterium]
MMEYGLIGEKLGHSFSKVIHNKIADYDYQLKELSPSQLDAFMKEKSFFGINVTIPYKKDVIQYLSKIDKEAEKIGAVNTVVNRNSSLYGYNTDIVGIKMLIKKILLGSNRCDLSGLDVLVLGTGGTSLTASVAAESLGASSVKRISRSGKDGALTYKEAEEQCKNAGFIINCTPCGMFPDDGESPISLDKFPRLIGVLDAIYNPIRTKLIRQALELGIPAEGGLYMLVAQAVAAYQIFTDISIDISEASEKIFKEILLEKENIVLVGMPSSGKTTVGKEIAKRLKHTFIDTDEEIVKEECRAITEIFSQDGEKVFREIESRVILKLSSGINGAVIATGGGAVLNPENVDRLRANGRIFWLDRPLEALMPTSDRPTASTPEAIKKRYYERLPIYKSRSDFRIDGDCTVNEAAERILKIIEQ